eukprot:gene7872-12341_t
MDVISIGTMEQTKDDFSDCKILQEFNNYLQVYDKECDLIVNIYHYNKNNIHYGLFLHIYPIDVVEKVLNNLNNHLTVCCDCLLDNDGNEIKINNYPDVLGLTSDEILKGGNLFNSVAELSFSFLRSFPKKMGSTEFLVVLFVHDDLRIPFS